MREVEDAQPPIHALRSRADSLGSFQCGSSPFCNALAQNRVAALGVEAVEGGLHAVADEMKHRVR